MDYNADNQTANSQNQGWSWMGFLFTTAYYAGYGKIKVAIIMNILCLVTFGLCTIILPFYCGLKAKKELPVGQVPFSWANVGILFAISIGMALVMTLVFEMILAMFL